MFPADPALAADSALARANLDASRNEWEARYSCFPLPALTPGMARDFLARARATQVSDVAITEFRGVSAVWTPVAIDDIEDQVWMHVVERGTWSIAGTHVVGAGQFLLRRGRLERKKTEHCETTPGTTARAVVLPAAMIKLLLRDRGVTGPADSAEARLLMAHVGMVQAMAADLGPDGLLADPELSPEMLARELSVSVRTLHRAFASAGEPAEESVASYIRRRRLEEARSALAVPSGRLSVTEIAAHWQFADASHFTRAFKKRYGCTPAEYARTARAAGASRLGLPAGKYPGAEPRRATSGLSLIDSA